MTDKKVTPAEARVTAENRVPMGVQRLKMGAVSIPGHMVRWFNDDPPGRINQALAGGWQFLERADAPGLTFGGVTIPNVDLGDRVARAVGTSKLGQPIVAYLMKIQQGWYDADQAEKMGQVNETNQLIKTGKLGEQAGDGRYVSQISITGK